MLNGKRQERQSKHGTPERIKLMKAQHKKLNKYVRKQIRQWLEDGWSERAVSDELGIDSERVRHFRAWNMETSLDKTSPEAYMDIWFLRYGWRLEADF